MRNRFPILASAKLKTEVGRARLTISRFSVFKTERISSLLGLDTNVQSRCLASTMSSHSARALMGSELRRYSKSVFSAVLSSSASWLGMRRTRRPGEQEKKTEEPG